MADELTSTDADDADARPAEQIAPRRKSRRRTVWYCLRAVLLVLMAPLIIVLIAPILFIGQEVTAPSWIKARVEEQAEMVLGGGSLSFGDITVTIERDLHPVVRIRDAVLRDADDALLARVPEIEALVSPRGLILNQEVLPQQIVLRRADLALSRNSDGSVAVSFDQSASPASQATSLTALLEGFDQTFERPALAALESLRVEGLVLNYNDARVGRSWVVDDARLSLEVSEESTVLEGDIAVLSGRAYVTTLSMRYSSDRGERSADIAINIEDAPAADIATQNPALSWLSVLDAQVSASMRASINDDGQLGPFFATLDIGEGALQPDAGAQAVRFDAAKAYLQYDPAEDLVRFEHVQLTSDWGTLRAEGQAYLRELQDGLPQALLGQFQILDLSLSPADLFADPIVLVDASLDFRLRPAPFSVEIGQFTVNSGDALVRGAGIVSASSDGWTVDVDAASDGVGIAEMLAYWPDAAAVRTREWFVENVAAGRFDNVSAGVRAIPGQAPQWAVSTEFSDVDVQYMRGLPPIVGGAGTGVLQENGLTLMLDEGEVEAAQGGRLDLAGSVFRIPTLGIPEPPAELELRTNSSITAAMAILDVDRFGLISRANLPVALADGRARVTGLISFLMKRRAPPQEGTPRRMADDLDFEFSVALSDVRSGAIVPDRQITARALSLLVDREGVQIAGQARVGDVPMTAQWGQTFGSQQSRLTAEVELSDAFFNEFNIGLPPGMVSGAGTGTLTLTLARGAPPAFELTSNLRGLSMSLPALGWSKGRNTTGSFAVSGRLGAVPTIDRISLDVAGLTASGQITLRNGGGLERARFDRVRLGGWLDGAVDLIGRGAGQPVGVEIRGGSLDLRRANFGQGGGGTGPMTISLDRLQVNDTIRMDGFRGTFNGNGGFNGSFTARLNGAAAIDGIVTPVGNRSAVRIQSGDAGAVLGAAGLLQTARGGALQLTLSPTGGAGTYDGVLRVTDLRVRDAPALAALLDAISVVGLLQQLDGQGLAFSEVDANFRISPDRITVTQASAIGPGLGLSVDGFYQTAGRVMDFQGVVSPLYLINGVGSVLTRPGEGLFGFNFTLRGPVDNAQVGVNPLSVLTPGMFREIFRRPPPVVE